MRGKKAKKIRREIYGDESLKAPREYVSTYAGTLSTGSRRRYLAAKREGKR